MPGKNISKLLKARASNNLITSSTNWTGVTVGGPSRQAAFSRSWVTGRCCLGTGEGEGGWRCSLLLHLDLGSRGAAAWVQRKGAGKEGKARQGSGGRWRIWLHVARLRIWAAVQGWRAMLITQRWSRAAAAAAARMEGGGGGGLGGCAGIWWARDCDGGGGVDG